MNTANLPFVTTRTGHTFVASMVSFLTFVWVKPVIARIGHELSLRAAERELNALHDDVLADMGITRHEIKAAVRGRLAD